MIIKLNNTSVSEIDKKLTSLKKKNGLTLNGIVFSLVVLIDDINNLNNAIKNTELAASHYPSRILFVVKSKHSDDFSLDAEIRFGENDSLNNQILIIHTNKELFDDSLFLISTFTIPDTKIISWIPENNISLLKNDITKLTQKRITTLTDGMEASDVFRTLLENFSANDIDLTWTKITHMRSVILNQIKSSNLTDLQSVVFEGPKNKLTVDFLSAWFASISDVSVTRKIGNYITTLKFKDQEIKLQLDTSSTDRLQIIINGEIVNSQTMPSQSFNEILQTEIIRFENDSVYKKVLESFNKVKYA